MPNPTRSWPGIGRLVAQKFDGSKHRQYPGRPPVSSEVEALVVRMARENSGWGYDRIVGALANLGHRLSDQTVKNILRRHGIAPAPKRSQVTSWKDFLAAHMNVLAGCDFFTVEVLSWRGLVTYYVLFFLHLESRRVNMAGITRHPDQEWMEQIGRSATQETWGYLHPCRYVLHDRDTKFCASFRSALASGGVKTIPLPAKSPNLNAFAERWVRSVKQECLSKVILFGEGSLSRVLTEYSRHYHHERNHQGKGNRLLFPDVNENQASAQPLDRMSSATWRPAQILPARRMNIFTKRAWVDCRAKSRFPRLLERLKKDETE